MKIKIVSALVACVLSASSARAGAEDSRIGVSLNVNVSSKSKDDGPEKTDLPISMGVRGQVTSKSGSRLLDGSGSLNVQVVPTSDNRRVTFTQSGNVGVGMTRKGLGWGPHFLVGGSTDASESYTFTGENTGFSAGGSIKATIEGGANLFTENLKLLIGAVVGAGLHRTDPAKKGSDSIFGFVYSYGGRLRINWKRWFHGRIEATNETTLGTGGKHLAENGGRIEGNFRVYDGTVKIDVGVGSSLKYTTMQTPLTDALPARTTRGRSFGGSTHLAVYF